MGVQIPPPNGVRIFALVCVGQAITNFGSNLTGFALGVWVYQTTGSATKFALVSVLMLLPGIVMAPVAGALVDRWDRRRVMIVNDCGYALITALLLVLVRSGRLELWHIYLVMPVGAIFYAFQAPAFAASTPLLVPKRHLGRASGFVQAGTAGALILAPLTAGVMLEITGLFGVMMIDLVTAGFAVTSLMMVRIPRPESHEQSDGGWNSILPQVTAGWRYIRKRPGLLALLCLAASLSFSIGCVEVLLTPLVLSFASAKGLGLVLTSASIGMLAGSLVMGVWGGPRRRINGILGLLLVQGVILILGVSRPNLLLVAAAAGGFMFFNPIVVGCGRAIWQSKVPPGIQGRVLSLREMLANATLLLAFLAAGPLADYVFRPLLTANGPLAGSVGTVIGVGPGRGIALQLIFLGLLLVVTIAVASGAPRLRNLEKEIPDAIPDAIPDSAPAAPGEDSARGPTHS